MSYWILSAIESAVFIGIFLIAVYLFIPKAAKNWILWKQSENSVYLSNAFANGIAAFFLILANLILFIRALIGF